MEKEKVKFEISTIRRFALVILFASGQASIALADQAPCGMPTAISPPSSLDTDDVANEWIAKMDRYTLDIEEFLVCVARHIEANQDTLTNGEITNLRRSQERATDQARQTADKWNKAFSSYQQRTPD